MRDMLQLRKPREELVPSHSASIIRLNAQNQLQEECLQRQRGRKKKKKILSNTVSGTLTKQTANYVERQDINDAYCERSFFNGLRL